MIHLIIYKNVLIFETNFNKTSLYFKFFFLKKTNNIMMFILISLSIISHLCLKITQKNYLRHCCMTY